MLDLSSLSTIICPIITAFQSILDTFFSAFSFLGISAPSLTSLLSSVITCTS